MKCLQRIVLLLCSAFALSFFGATAIHAAYLNDIRVGEYDSHTRIVFELSEATAFERIISRSPGQLTVIFANTKPQLVRKIPLERATRVQAIKVVSLRDSLSLELDFSFDHFRYELMEFNKPFRLVVDVYHLAATAEPLSSETQPDQQVTENVRDVPADASPTPQDEPAGAQQPATITASAPVTDTKTDEPAPVGHVPVTLPEAPMTQQPSPPPAPQPLPPPHTLAKTPDADETAVSGFKGLQYWLVVGMVVMTIVILVLLLLMLIFKQPGVNDKGQKTNGSLAQHDKHIAEIDAKINEQLKRYEEA